MAASLASAAASAGASAAFHLAVPGVWRSDALDPAPVRVVPTGHATLDAHLPGQGWPLASLTEVCQHQPGLHEWRLLGPALATAAARGVCMLIGSPHVPHLAALGALGLRPAHIIRVQGQTPAERLWATEQALRCRDLGAVLVWLPQARAEQLRRLHLAAQAHQRDAGGPLVWACRPWDAQQEASPAPLRLTVAGRGRAGLDVRVFKRRGPAMEEAVRVPAHLPVMRVFKRALAATHDRVPASHALDRSAAPRRPLRAVTA